MSVRADCEYDSSDDVKKTKRRRVGVVRLSVLLSVAPGDSDDALCQRFAPVLSNQRECEEHEFECLRASDIWSTPPMEGLAAAQLAGNLLV